MVIVVCFYEIGGFEVLCCEIVEVGKFGLGQVCLCYEVVGLNFVDMYFCLGLYFVFCFVGMGVEVVGIVEVVGDGVSNVVVGDCVIYIGFINMLGVYSIE